MSMTREQAGLLGAQANSKRIRSQFLPNTKFGKWQVIDIDLDTSNGLFINVVCECGVVGRRRSSSLSSGYSKGCKKCTTAKGEKNNKWSGYKDMPGTVFHRIRSSAKTRNINFNITIEEIYHLFDKQNRKCWFTGEELTWKTASLDRIDSHKPYNIKNVIWVHRDVNYMKHTFTLSEFVQRCNQIAEHRGSDFK